MKLTTKQLKQIIKEEMYEVMYEAEGSPKMFSFLMRDANEVLREIGNVMPKSRDFMKIPELAPYTDYLSNISTRRKTYGQIITPIMSPNDLIYQPELHKEITQALINLKNKLNSPVFAQAEQLMMDMKELSAQKFHQHRELFFSDDRDDNPNWRVRAQGLTEHARQLEMTAETIEKIINKRNQFNPIIDLNLKELESSKSFADDIMMGFD